MAKAFRSRRGRLSAQLHGKAKEVGPEEARVRSVLSHARKVTTLETKLRNLNREVKTTKRELKGARKILRALIQSDKDMALEDQMVRQEEDRIEAGQARWAETGSSRKH